MIYSPYHIEDYRLPGVKTDAVTTIMEGDRAEAVWNLYWLSDPTLDTIPGSGNDWNKTYKLNTRLLVAIMADVDEDEVLYRKLSMGPEEFRLWWERQDVSIFDTFDCVEGWYDLVRARAKEAALRMAPRHEGNVVHVQFRRSA